MKITWHTEGLPEFQKAFRRYEAASSKSYEEAVKHRTGRFGFTLFRLFNAKARQTRTRIRRIPAYKMRVRDGARSQRQEKARRIFATGFAAAGWLVAALRFRRPGASVRALNKVDSPRGRVSLNLRGAIRSADLFNFAPGAADTDAKHGLSAKAYAIETADMNKYLERQALRAARRF
jgi:hypothetical protein